MRTIFYTLTAILLLNACTQQEEKKHMTKTATDKNGNSYEYVTNDPLGVKLYTLENGLKIYLSENPDEPRIQTLIAVRAGSKNDPAETTGLAHYLEHMVFKGTSKIGALNWEKEQPLLDEIKNLYEAHKTETDPEKKKAIYAKIDSVSNQAAAFAASNEYDKLISSIGAKFTNAFTSNDQTVYMNDIPANELEKWAKVESERFNELVLRLFHTELETVYEEFNMGQDNDNRKVYQAIMEALFTPHPYGTQTTIGEGEHLKNPSMVNIENFWNTYYRSNNMAICLSGDIDAADAFVVLKDNFSSLRTNPEVKQPAFAGLSPISEPLTKEVVGPDAESVNVAFRFDKATSEDRPYLMLIDAMLNNRQAGLIDLNLIQKQKVLSAYTYGSYMADHSMFLLNAKPLEGQNLDEAKDLLLGELEKLKTMLRINRLFKIFI